MPKLLHIAIQLIVVGMYISVDSFLATQPPPSFYIRVLLALLIFGVNAYIVIKKPWPRTKKENVVSINHIVAGVYIGYKLVYFQLDPDKGFDTLAAAIETYLYYIPLICLLAAGWAIYFFRIKNWKKIWIPLLVILVSLLSLK